MLNASVRDQSSAKRAPWRNTWAAKLPGGGLSAAEAGKRWTSTSAPTRFCTSAIARAPANVPRLDALDKGGDVDVAPLSGAAFGL